MIRDIDWPSRKLPPLPILAFWLLLLACVAVAGMWWGAA